MLKINKKEYKLIQLKCINISKFSKSTFLFLFLRLNELENNVRSFYTVVMCQRILISFEVILENNYYIRFIGFDCLKMK